MSTGQQPTRDPFSLEGRVAVVTGAGSGLGRAIAIGLAGRGTHTFVLDVNGAAGSETVGLIGSSDPRATAFTCDVRDQAQVADVFRAIEDDAGGVDILVNNAAIGSHVHPEQLSLEEWNDVLAVNLTGYFLCAQEAGRRMIASSRGSIVNISSIGGFNAIGRGNLAYDVSKAGVLQLTRELAVEWARHNVRVNAVLPCQVRTPALERLINEGGFEAEALVQRFLAGIPIGRLALPEDVVGPVLFLASDAASMITGVGLPIDGGNLALNAGGTASW